MERSFQKAVGLGGQKPIPGNILNFLSERKVDYTLIQNEYERQHISADQKIRVVLLRDSAGTLMAMAPESVFIDIQVLSRDLNRQFELLSLEQAQPLFPDCEPGVFPPLPELYHLEGMIDNRLNMVEMLYFEPGVHSCMIGISQDAFKTLQERFWHGDFTESTEGLAAAGRLGLNSFSEVVHRFMPLRMRERIQETIELPAIPAIAEDILRLRVDPAADAKALGKIVERDPSLASQLISWAQSPYYGYPGQVTSVEEAIIKVLGFDLVMNLALGIAVGRAMRVPLEGPLGLKAFWVHSVCTANLVEALLKHMPSHRRPVRGLAYLCGLLHNMGYLLLGQVFPPQFALLNQAVSLNPHRPVPEIEHYVLGVGHEQIGAWLMQSWHMPEEVISTIRFHHHVESALSHTTYVQLVFVAVRLLWTLGMGDTGTSDIPPFVLKNLGLTPAHLEAALASIAQKHEELAAIAKELTK